MNLHRNGTRMAKDWHLIYVGLAQSLSMDWRQSGAWLGLTPDWHLIDAPVIQLVSPLGFGMILDWHRIDIRLALDYHRIGTRFAGLAIIWHCICNESTPRWWGLAALWLLIYISLTIDMVLALDWYQIGNGFRWIGIGLTLNWLWIVTGLYLYFQRINSQATLAWQPISAGLT